jgi:very-short-patch-repair endonuclease
MRHIPTEAEALPWEHLRRGKLGVRFRRQHPIAGYIPDFVCLSHKLVLEADGPIHEERQDHDTNRDAYLYSLGYRIIRFTNQQVLEHTEEVLDSIAAALNKHRGSESEARRTRKTKAPSPSGRGLGER